MSSIADIASKREKPGRLAVGTASDKEAANDRHAAVTSVHC
jgi:hypothetical protein